MSATINIAKQAQKVHSEVPPVVKVAALALSEF